MREMNVERIFEEYNRNSDELALKSRSFLPACAGSQRHLRMTNKCGIRRKLIAMKYGFLRTAHNCKQQFKETSLLSNLGSAHTHTHTYCTLPSYIFIYNIETTAAVKVNYSPLQLQYFSHFYVFCCTQK